MFNKGNPYLSKTYFTKNYYNKIVFYKLKLDKKSLKMIVKNCRRI